MEGVVVVVEVVDEYNAKKIRYTDLLNPIVRRAE